MRNHVCDQYQHWFNEQVQRGNPDVIRELERLYELGQQRPVKLICYCAPKRCHADTIAAFLNAHLKIAE